MVIEASCQLNNYRYLHITEKVLQILRHAVTSKATSSLDHACYIINMKHILYGLFQMNGTIPNFIIVEAVNSAN